MKTQFIEYKYIAPKNFILQVLSPIILVQRGGIRAVAIATPGIGFPFQLLLLR
jgi:hypothetical protein